MTDGGLDNEAREEFLEESREHLDAIEPDLLTLEQGEAGDLPDTVNRLFRAIHSIKGASPFLGCEPLKELSHVMESLLMRFRDGEMRPDPDTVDALLAGVDKLRLMLDDIDHGDDISCNDEISSLQTFLGLDAPAEQPAPKARPKKKSRKTAKKKASGLRAKLQAKLGIAEKIRRDRAGAAPAKTELSSTTTPAGKPEPQKDKTKMPAASPRTASRAETIRVSVELIDRLINLAGELVLSRNQFRRKLEGAMRDIAGLPAALQSMDRITSDLQEDIMRMRMQPVSNLLGKFPRIVRDLSRKLNRKIEIEIHGGEVELDRSILEGLTDPMTHIIRNSIDHGIRPPDEREAVGKPPVGHIRIDAAHEGGQVVVTVSDDGRGIDPETVAAKAVERGLLTEERARTLSDKEKQHFIFHPGFSTAESVSEVSGRGVGMDVVKTNIEKLGGQVEIESAPERGTTLRLRLPLTLAIIQALMVGAGEQRFAIPQVNVRELVRIRKREIDATLETIGDAEVLRLRDRLLPIVRLGDALSLDRCGLSAHDGDNGDVHVVVLRHGADRYGLLVDDLFSTEEIVVKPLGRHVEKASTFSGTTIMGDGRVAMILDVTGLAAFSGLRFSEFEAEQRRIREEEDARIESLRAEQERMVMIFECAPGEHFAVPVPDIARLERLVNPRIDRIGVRDYIRVREDAIPLIRLERYLPVSPFPEDPEEMFLIVPKSDGPPVGLAVSRIIDALSTTVTLREAEDMPAGVVGSAVIEDRVTLFLDTDELLARMRKDAASNGEEEYP